MAIDSENTTLYIKGKTTKYLTIGGIIVDEKNEQILNKEYDRIVSTYFNFPLPTNFKLHYEELRNAHTRNANSIYKKVSHQRKEISDEMFNAIKKVNCKLLSVSINIENHCKKYPMPVHIVGYALFILMERFQYFLNDNYGDGKIIYERYSNKLKHKVHNVHMFFKNHTRFPNYTTFKNIIGNIKNGNPLEEPLLSFADFFVYAPWIKCESCCKKCCRYDEIKYKYYNFDHFAPRLRGNVEI